MKETVLKYSLLLLLTALAFSLCRPGRVRIQTRTLIDTVVVRDTVRDTLLIPRKVYIARVDTVFLQAAGDTVRVPVLAPMERKEYRTDDYHAIVEGFRPSLVSMAVYPETRYVTRTETRTLTKRPRFGVGVQAGVGYNGERFGPYVGIGIQYNIFTF